MEQNQNNGKASGARMDFSHAARVLQILGGVAALLLFASSPGLFGLALGIAVFIVILSASFLLIGQETILFRMEQGQVPVPTEQQGGTTNPAE